MFVWSFHNDDYLQEIYKDNKPEERSLDVGPAHVDLHAGRLVQEDVVLGGGWEDVREWEGGGWRGLLSFCHLMGLRDSLLGLIQPWTSDCRLLWWCAAINCLQLKCNYKRDWRYTLQAFNSDTLENGIQCAKGGLRLFSLLGICSLK